VAVACGNVEDVDTGVRVLRRFVRWGCLHGPVWGAITMLLAHLLPDGAGRTGRGLPTDILVGALVGLVVGPLIGFLVGSVCLIADRLPRWLLDAPDYVAIATVVAAAAIAELELGTVDGVVAWLTVGCLALAPAADAALVAPALLHPSESQPGAGSRNFGPWMWRLLPIRR
jgi:hypothetical protein